MCCVSDSVCELFGEPIHNIVCVVAISLLNVVKVLSCGWRCAIGYTVYSLPKSVCVCVCVLWHVIPVCSYR